MHLSELEKMRMEKDHKMRNGYNDHSNKKYPHVPEVDVNDEPEMKRHGVE